MAVADQSIGKELEKLDSFRYAGVSGGIEDFHKEIMMAAVSRPQTL